LLYFAFPIFFLSEFVANNNRKERFYVKILVFGLLWENGDIGHTRPYSSLVIFFSSGLEAACTENGLLGRAQHCLAPPCADTKYQVPFNG